MTRRYPKGTMVGEYRIEESLGGGHLAHVYRAERDGRSVALKVLESDDADHRARFEREAASTRHLRHPNLVRVLDHGECNGAVFIAMELCHGPNLAVYLKERKAISVANAAHLGRQICAALQTAHDEGLVHRDLKPSNILLHPLFSDPLALKVADFGLLKPVGENSLHSGSEISGLGEIRGSPLYISPEAIRGQVVTPAADQYALGVILYRAVSGKLPYRVTGAVNAMVAHLHGEPIPLRERVPERGIPESFCTLVMTMLEKDPEKRMPSMRAVSAQLQRITNEESSHSFGRLSVATGLTAVFLLLLAWFFGGVI